MPKFEVWGIRGVGGVGLGSDGYATMADVDTLPPPEHVHDWRTCMTAAEGGHLDVLKYAHKNGCPWIKQSCHWGALYHHHSHVVVWIDAQPE